MIEKEIRNFFEKNKGELGCGGELVQLIFIEDEYVFINSKYTMDINTTHTLKNIVNGKLVYRSAEGKTLVYRLIGDVE